MTHLLHLTILTLTLFSTFRNHFLLIAAYTTLIHSRLDYTLVMFTTLDYRYTSTTIWLSDFGNVYYTYTYTTLTLLTLSLDFPTLVMFTTLTLTWLTLHFATLWLIYYTYLPPSTYYTLTNLLDSSLFATLTMLCSLLDSTTLVCLHLTTTLCLHLTTTLCSLDLPLLTRLHHYTLPSRLRVPAIDMPITVPQVRLNRPSCNGHDNRKKASPTGAEQICRTRA